MAVPFLQNVGWQRGTLFDGEGLGLLLLFIRSGVILGCWSGVVRVCWLGV